MTVAELINELGRFPRDARVLVHGERLREINHLDWERIQDLGFEIIIPSFVLPGATEQAVTIS